MPLSNEDMFRFNRANWEERVPIHLRSYPMEDLLAGHGKLTPMEEREFAPRPGERVLHLQCHFGCDSLAIAQRGVEVVGVDFATSAVAEASRLASQLGLQGRARFVDCNLYDAPASLDEPAAFDWVFVNWGAINWLPDIRSWAAVVRHFLRPGGRLYLAEAHPCAYVFEDSPAGSGADRPEWLVPYFDSQARAFDNDRTYTGAPDLLRNTRTYEWLHTLSAIFSALLEQGLALEAFREHDSVPWQMFRCLQPDGNGMYHWPAEPWLPLAFTLTARAAAHPMIR